MFNSHYIIYKYMQHIRAGDTAQLTSFPGLIPSTHTWLSVPLVPRNLPLSSALCRHCMHVFTVRFISLFHKMLVAILDDFTSALFTLVAKQSCQSKAGYPALIFSPVYTFVFTIIVLNEQMPRIYLLPILLNILMNHDWISKVLFFLFLFTDLEFYSFFFHAVRNTA